MRRFGVKCECKALTTRVTIRVLGKTIECDAIGYYEYTKHVGSGVHVAASANVQWPVENPSRRTGANSQLITSSITRSLHRCHQHAL